MEKQKTLLEVFEELGEALQVIIDVAVEWYKEFTKWLARTARDIIAALIQIYTDTVLLSRGVNNHRRIMQKKIHRYMEYKRLQLWLRLQKEK